MLYVDSTRRATGTRIHLPLHPPVSAVGMGARGRGMDDYTAVIGVGHYRVNTFARTNARNAGSSTIASNSGIRCSPR